MSNVIQFNPKKHLPRVTDEMIEEMQLQDQNEFIDKTIEYYIIEAIDKFVDIEKDNVPLMSDDSSSKMIAFLRESLVATLHMLQNKEHPLHLLANELVEFTDTQETKEKDID